LIRKQMAIRLAELLLRTERMRLGLRAKVAHVGGEVISYWETATSIPQDESALPIICVHGIGGDKDHFARFAPKFAKHRRVISVDLPGFGESPRKVSEQSLTVEAQSDFLVQFALTLGLPRAHWLGNSMGGLIVNKLAERHPEHVATCALFAPALVPGATETPMMQKARTTRTFDVLEVARTDAKRTATFLFVDPPWAPAALYRLYEARAERDHALHHAVFGLLAGHPGLGGHERPTLCLWGEEDQVLHVSGAEAILHVLPQAEVVRLEATGHLPMLERPGLCATLLAAFLRRHDSC
jgi:abhydrolase domain-containing protein 6